MTDAPQNLPLEQKEPHFTELLVLYEKYRKKKTKEWVFKKWMALILPDEPQIKFAAFLNYTQRATRRLEQERNKERDLELRTEGSSAVDRIVNKREATLVQLEESLRGTVAQLVDNASTIMQSPEDADIKEKYFALAVATNVWGKIQEEKKISIKAHAEKRESVGLFAKLLRSAMSGEFTMRDVEVMKQTHGTAAEDAPGIEGAAVGTN